MKEKKSQIDDQMNINHFYSTWNLKSARIKRARCYAGERMKMKMKFIAVTCDGVSSGGGDENEKD